MTLPSELLAGLAADDTAIVLAVVALRLVVPLFIPRLPLVIVAALVIDGIDQTIFQQFTTIDTTETGLYQSYDKALDVYYLAIAYLSTMRNWTSLGAFRVGQFLFFYRLVGVTLFELADSRWLLLVFPNTFEYFFIVYEVIRLRYEPSRFSTRFWILTAAAIWVFVKLPQEYWIHIAKLDFTEAVRDNPAFAAAVVLGLLALAVAVVVLRKRLPAADHGVRFEADPLPISLEEADERHVRKVRDGRFLTAELAEKIVLLALVCVIFSQILPSVTASALQISLGVAAIVCANAAVSLVYIRRRGAGIESSAIRFLALLAVNFVFVVVASGSVFGDETFPVGHGLFFAYLIALVLWLYDRFRPMYDARAERVAALR